MGFTLLTILIMTSILSSDAVPLISVTICSVIFTYELEAWTDASVPLSEWYFTGGWIFCTVTLFEWGWCQQVSAWVVQAGRHIAVNLTFRHHVCWPERSEQLGSTSCEVRSQVGSFEVQSVSDVLLEPVGRTPCTASCEDDRTRTVPCSSSLVVGLWSSLSLCGWIVLSGSGLLEVAHEVGGCITDV
jgi:hypothetical protein